jgi:hypothetical protein
VSWRFDKVRDVYTRFVSGRAVKDAQGNSVEADNVLVIKTDAQVLDEKGRLRLRTTGSGDAVAYRDGNKYSLRWRRSPGIIRFEGEGGVEFCSDPAKPDQVTTDDVCWAEKQPLKPRSHVSLCVVMTAFENSSRACSWSVCA